MRAMKLTDLPFDMLEEVLFQAMCLCWSGIDFTLCSKETAKLLHTNRRRIMGFLCHRPWSIKAGVMHAEIDSVLGSDYCSLHHSVRYLELGWIRKLELHCTALTLGDDGRILRDDQVQDWQLECVLGDWPANKLVLVYDLQ